MGATAATLTMNLAVTEQLVTDVPLVNAGNINLVHDGLNFTAILNTTSTPAISMVSAQSVALTAGAVTLDFTALLGVNGASLTATGLKLQILRLRNLTGNAAMTFTFGASNGYLGLGTGWKFTLPAGQTECVFYCNGGSTAVDSTHKTVDVTGTGSQSFEYIAVFG